MELELTDPGSAADCSVAVALEGWIAPSTLESLRELLRRLTPGEAEFEAELRALWSAHGDCVYTGVLHLLCHLLFPPPEARRRWESIRLHRDNLTERLADRIDFRVALLSYFLQINGELQQPKIIEMSLFERTEATASVDELTGLSNYRQFRTHLDLELQRAKRYTDPLSLVMVDIDHFKGFNDRNGHLAGNEALAIVGSIIASSLRSVDLPARFGGEEFALILPSTPKAGAGLVAERIRTAIRDHPFPNRGHQPGGRLTASLGVASFPADAGEPLDLVRRADRALYVAKDRGRDRVYLYGACRRSYRRLEAALDGRFCQISAELEPLRTVNISQGGVLLHVGRQLPVGSLLQLELCLSAEEAAIRASCRVIRVESTEDGGFEAALRILEIEDRDHARLARFIDESDDDDAYLEPMPPSDS